MYLQHFEVCLLVYRKSGDTPRSKVYILDLVNPEWNPLQDQDNFKAQYSGGKIIALWQKNLWLGLCKDTPGAAFFLDAKLVLLLSSIREIKFSRKLSVLQYYDIGYSCRFPLLYHWNFMRVDVRRFDWLEHILKKIPNQDYLLRVCLLPHPVLKRTKCKISLATVCLSLFVDILLEYIRVCTCCM